MARKIEDIGVRTVIENLGQFLSGMDRYNRAIGRAEESTRRFGERATRAGASLAAMAAPILGIAALSLRTFASFEQSMAKVEAITQATAEEMAELTAIAQEMGRTTVFTAQESAQALSFMAMAGLSVTEQMGALPQVLQLAAAGALDLGSAADIVTNIMAGFGLEVDELGRANDVLVTGFTSANTDLVQLAQAFKFAGPVAKAAGITFEETAASLALMGNAGIQASMAGTGLRGAITRLLNPSNEAASVIENLGIQVLDASGKMLPLVDIIEQLETSGLTAANAMQIFGQRAGPAMLALVSQGSAALRELVVEMEASGGTAQRIAEVQLDTFQGSLTLLKSAAEGAQIAIGEALAPAMRSLAEALQPILSGLAIWIGQNPALVLTVTALAAIVGTLGIGLVAVGFILPGVIAGIGIMTTAIAFLTTAVLGLFAALGPVGLVILAIGAALVVGLIIWRNWEKVLGAVKTVLNAIASVINVILEGLALIPRLFGLDFSVPNIPAFAGGGVSRGGPGLVGERGPEVVSMPPGAVVSPVSRSSTFNVTAHYSRQQDPQTLRSDLEAMTMAAGG